MIEDKTNDVDSQGHYVVPVGRPGALVEDRVEELLTDPGVDFSPHGNGDGDVLDVLSPQRFWNISRLFIGTVL